MKMGRTSKLSFERRLKRKGIEPRSPLTNDNSNKLTSLRNLEFWIWDKAEHKKRFDSWLLVGRQRGSKDARPCCFQHAIGLPRKNGVPKPLFDYEKGIYDALQETKYVWIKKATGLGITEFMLRYIAWLCLQGGDKLKGSQMCIVTGPRIELAITLINRLKGLFPDVKFEDKETVCTLNDVRIEAFPSHHLDAMRGLTQVSFILLDEADFFPPGQQQQARAVSERYIAKSGENILHIVMVSTPNAPEGLFEQMEQEPDNECLYKRIFLPYHIGLGKIYTEKEIAKAQGSPSFEREYNLQYIGEQGNVFSYESIERATSAGLQLNEKHPIDLIPQDMTKSMGIDAGFGSSKFGIVVTQSVENKIQVLYAEEFERPDFYNMINKILKMFKSYVISKIYIDAANPEIITSIKAGLGERTDYERHISILKQKHLNYFNISRWMNVIPMSFSSDGHEMLAHAKFCLDNDWLAIHPSFSKLIIALRTAVATDGLLDKQSTAHNEVLDAFRLCLQFYKSK
jgi:hypothetical protein